jgi:hypothetical protein
LATNHLLAVGEKASYLLEELFAKPAVERAVSTCSRLVGSVALAVAHPHTQLVGDALERGSKALACLFGPNDADGVRFAPEMERLSILT